MEEDDATFYMTLSEMIDMLTLLRAFMQWSFDIEGGRDHMAEVLEESGVSRDQLQKFLDSNGEIDITYRIEL